MAKLSDQQKRALRFLRIIWRGALRRYYWPRVSRSIKWRCSRWMDWPRQGARNAAVVTGVDSDRRRGAEGNCRRRLVRPAIILS